jgi:putative FmdB family regulatory protein
LYEFECESCHRRFERIQKFSDPSPDVCPHCGKGPIRKLLSTPAIQFKGSGFYITDYGKDGKKGESTAKASKDSKDTSTTSAAKDKDSSASTSTSSESSKSETKTESSKSSDTSTKKESS